MPRREMIDWLYGLQHFGIKLGLEQIRALLAALGHPERAFRSAHLAGTNGKGSVAAMIDAMLAAHGVRSGLFTSPHLVRPNERVRIAGRNIGDHELDERLRGLRRTIAEALAEQRLPAHPSFFEVVTALALEAFRDHGLEAAVLEVGLGGRLDATNAVEPDVGVVVSIALDHTKTLGGSIEAIATEKAGIVKPGLPVVSGAVQQRAVDVLRSVCRERGATFVDARMACQLMDERDGRLELRTGRARYPDLELSLAGRHQIDNARVALTAFELLVERLGRESDPAAVRLALAGVHWPGRLQWVDEPGGVRLLFDAAHNLAGVRTLVAYLRSLGAPRPVLLFGASKGKPVAAMLAALGAVVERAVITRPPVEKGLPGAEVLAAGRESLPRPEAIDEPASALAAARRLAAESDGFVLVTGSLYLVGHVLGLLCSEEVPGPLPM